MTPGPDGPVSRLSLEGRVALVTGAAGGIGAATCRALAALGAAVWATDLPGTTLPAERAVPADLADAQEAGRVVGEVTEAAGGLDVLVHAAGIARDAVLWKMTPEAWRAVLAVNLDAAFHLLRAATPSLRARGGGSVVLVASINGERGKRGQANYAASKAGLIALARTAAIELGAFGVRVNAVAPGFVETPMTAALPPEVREAAVRETLLGRAGRPEEVADAIAFLCSDLARHVTGQVLRVDGGQLRG